MARVLFVSNPFYGHAAPVLAIAKELLTRNVTVAWSLDDRFTGLCKVIEDAGIPIYSRPSLQFLVTEDERRRMHTITGQTSLSGLFRSLITMNWKVLRKHRRSFFPDPCLLEAQVKGLLEIIEEFQPDAIVAEACVRVPVAAERAQLPWAYVGIGSVALPEVNYELPSGFFIVSDRSLRFLYRIAKVVWRKHFYEAGANRLVSPFLNILGSTPEIEGVEDLSTPVEFVGSLLFDGQVGVSVPDWFWALPPDRPLVYVTVGTSVRGTEFFELAIEALSELEDVEVVITTGMQHDLSETSVSSPNVHVAQWIPNSLIMERADVAIIHGALSTTIGCIAAGTPAIVLGWYIDQGFYAYRLEELGVGVRLPFWKVSKKRLQSAVKTILSDTSYHQRAIELRSSIEALGGATRAADLVLQMIADFRRSDKGEKDEFS